MERGNASSYHAKKLDTSACLLIPDVLATGEVRLKRKGTSRHWAETFIGFLPFRVPECATNCINWWQNSAELQSRLGFVAKLKHAPLQTT